MSKLNTVFNGASAHYNRRTAQNTAETARRTIEIAAADRHRDLRARGLIDDRSTPRQIAAVEHRLDAQMRARRELEGDLGRDPYRPAILAGVALGLIGLVLAVQNTGRPLFLLGLFAVVIGVPAVIALVVRQRVQRRFTIAGRAALDACGICTWCRGVSDHVVDGVVEHPRVAHAVEVEQEIGGLR